MWLMTKHGFYSIVQKQPGEFHVRARVRKDLENLVARIPLAGAKIRSSKETDYPYRLIAGREEVRKVIQFLGDTLDYSNFNATVAKTTDQREKLAVYERLWHMLLDKFGGYGKIAAQQKISTP
jgi:hypothetical protein